jgi:hypothetical protein
MFGRRFDPQEFDLDVATRRDGTISLPLSAIESAGLLEWDDSNLRGADHTYAVRVDAPSEFDEPVLLQLGHGRRNRGTGRPRHEMLVRWLQAAGGATAAEETTAVASNEASDPVDATASGETDDANAPDAPAAMSGATSATADVVDGDSAPSATTAETAETPATSPEQSPGQSAAVGEQTGEADRPGADGHTDSNAHAGADGQSGVAGQPDAGDDVEADVTETVEEPSWLSSIPDATVLILKNQSDIPLEPRIRCRWGSDSVVLDDVQIGPGETYRWEDLPEEGPVYVDVLFGHGSRTAEQVPEDALRPGPVGIDLYASGSEIRTSE